MAIDIGNAAIDRTAWQDGLNTLIDKNNPANATGKITSIEIWARQNMSGVEVATFYVVSGNNLSTRDTHTIGNVTAGSKQTFLGLDITVNTGDYIGIYFTGGQIEADSSGGDGYWYLFGDNIPCTNTTFTATISYPMSLYGIGVTAPTVTTQACTSILSTSALGNGNITDAGGECTRRGFCYMEGVAGDPTTANSVAYDDGSFGTGAYTKGITGLTKGTYYRVRAYVVNATGTAYGTTVQILTDSEPTVTTQAVSNIAVTTITGNGNITATGGTNATRRGFCYMEGVAGDPTTANSVAYDDGSFGTGAYTKGITGLTKATGYRVRAYAINVVGTSYGATVQATTDEMTISTQAVSAILEITATGNGNITDTGGENATKRGVCWNTTGSPTIADSKSEELGSFGTGAFTRPMTGLVKGDRYYVKAYAYNSGGYSYGAEVNFYTYPAVTTYAPTNIIRADPTTVTANALIDLDVVEDITTRGFKYGLTEADTWNNSETGTYSKGAFSLTLTGLTADTTYFIRAYAVGAWGTKYGSWLEFLTAYPYGANKVEIRSEATASAGDIALVGGKRSLTIENHLIQTQTIADIISAAYLADYKDQKTKLRVTKPTPAPYTIGDTIFRKGEAAIPYAAVNFAVISYAAAANAVHYYNLAGRNMLIRKLNVNFSAGNYISILELES